MKKGKQIMGNEVPGEKAVKMNNLCLYPIKPIRSGEGLPYAPVDWPNLGDIWYWWLGNRTYHFGFYQDRFLYLPNHLCVRGLNCGQVFA